MFCCLNYVQIYKLRLKLVLPTHLAGSSTRTKFADAFLLEPVQIRSGRINKNQVFNHEMFNFLGESEHYSFLCRDPCFLMSLKILKCRVSLHVNSIV